MLLKERYDPVIEDVSRCDGMFAYVEFCKGYTAVGVNNGLLINAVNTFDGANVIGVLCHQIARVFGFNLTMGF